MDDIYDVAIIGLGAMGSAAAYQLSKEKGLKVIGIDQFTPPHEFGSSHGRSRITRLSVGEGLSYTPIVKKSHEIWGELEKKTGETLFINCGLLIIGEKENSIVTGSFAAAEKYHLAHSSFSNEDLRRDWGTYFTIPENNIGFYSPLDGLVIPETCIRTQLDEARAGGVTIKTDCAVTKLEEMDEIQCIHTKTGVVKAKKIIVCAGAWAKELIPELDVKVKVVRHVLYWFKPQAGTTVDLTPKSMPVFNIEFGLDGEDGNFLYGFPDIDNGTLGLKIATEHFGVVTEHADNLERVVSEKEMQQMFAYASPHLPWLSDCCVDAKACMYTQTKDFDFIIDTHPSNKNIVIAAGFSGHGFKHSAGIGVILRDLAISGKTDFDISNFKLDRITN